MTTAGTTLLWFLENLSLPLSAVAVAAMVVTWPRPKGTVWRRTCTYFFLRRLRAMELRSRDVHGSGQTPGGDSPSCSPGDRVGATRGGERADAAAAPPAPSTPAGAVTPRPRVCRARTLTNTTRYIQAPVGTHPPRVTETACPPAHTSGRREP